MSEQMSGPIRGEVLGAERLAARARTIARKQNLSSDKVIGRGKGPLLLRLEDSAYVLTQITRSLAEASSRGVDISSAGEWLLDNHYIIQEHIRDIRTSLPGKYYQELPKLTNGRLANFPRVYEIAIELIAHTEGRLDLANISPFVAEFQKIAPLKLGELWAIPTMLRLGLIENVRRMALRVAARLDEVEVADRWASRLKEAGATKDGLSTELAYFVDQHPPLTPNFVARFLGQIRSYQTSFAPLIWLEQWIAEDGLTAEDAVTRSNRRAAITQIIVTNSINSLRAIARLDWNEFVEEHSTVEAILRADPCSAYKDMTFASRDSYRHVIELLARRSDYEEDDVAQLIVDKAAAEVPGSAEHHVGYWLIDDGRPEIEEILGYRSSVRESVYRWIKKNPSPVYFSAILTAVLIVLLISVSAVGVNGWLAWLMVFLLLIPVSEVAIVAVNQLVTITLRPSTLAKMEYRDHGIPDSAATVVVVPTLFGGVSAVHEALEHAEVQFLANRDANLRFAILSDYTDSKTQNAPTDLHILNSAKRGVQALNEQYRDESGDVFFLLHRDRQWNESEGVWMGWERKRGKLSQFNKLLQNGFTTAFSHIVGNPDRLLGIQYVITLDSDTVLPRGAAHLMVGTITHPLNRPVYDEETRTVKRGYGILQPRVGVGLTSAHRSKFAAIHSGHPGVDPYTTAVSDVYQDLYGEGSFTGKGIYHVATFEKATHEQFPENTLLSHDLIEGNYARAGLLTDVEVYDEYPSRYLSYTRRKHRWIRGDWQISGWLRDYVPGPDGKEQNRLNTISHWKIFDNLRRSLLEISQLVLLLTGWFVLPGSPLRWTLLVAFFVAFPWVFSSFISLLRPPLDQSWKAYYSAVWGDMVTNAQQFALAVTFLPHQAWISADAIVRTLYRMHVSRAHLLEWQTSAHVERAMKDRSDRESYRRMWPAVVAGVMVIVLAVYAVITGNYSPANISGIAAVVFAVLPVGILWISSPTIAAVLSAPAIPGELKLSDNERANALRYARFHWKFFEEFVSERSNWLAPDNFQGSPDPVIAYRTSPTNIGLQLMSIVSACDLKLISTEDMIDRLEKVFDTMDRMPRHRGHLYNWYDIETLAVLEPAYISTVDSGNLAGHLIALKQACIQMLQEVVPRTREFEVEGRSLADGLVAATSRDLSKGTMAPQAEDEEKSDTATRLKSLADRAFTYAMEMDFTFLFDEKRKIFSIGYHTASDSYDNSYYDLLASEARLTSFIAIAKGDVDVEHWFKLGRSLADAAGTRVLVSWSGSMFEYLMPQLVTRSYPFTLLDKSVRGAVRKHIAYGEEKKVPWGISESAYNVRDRAMVYQYRAFGVPQLALKRGLGNDLVIAPYATLLAMLVEPRPALKNLSQLEALGALGPYGFRDAIDYTRPDAGDNKGIVDNYMAHHIGMSLVALTNALERQIWQRRFHADPLVRSNELVLHERVPRKLVVQETIEEESRTRPQHEAARPTVRHITTPHTPQPRVSLLGNIPSTTLITNSGGGHSRYGDIVVTRWRRDATRDNQGEWIYLKDLSSGSVWSATHQPIGADADEYRVQFATDRAQFNRTDGLVETQMEVVVSSEDAATVRKLTITNRSSAVKEIEVTSYAEIVLQSLDADRQHPAFGNLFIQTEWSEQNSALLATRRVRSSTEDSVWAAHVVAVGPEAEGPVSYETDRAKFIGRGKSVRHPVALDEGAQLSNTAGAPLDPIFSLRVKLRIPPGRMAQVSFTTLVTSTRERAIELADLYDNMYSARRALDLSWAQAQAELRDLDISPGDAAIYQQLAGYLLYPHPRLRPTEGEFFGSTRGQQSLWPLGISGDLPILLATIDSMGGIPSVKQLLQAHQYWRIKGVVSDLVILNEHAPSYIQDLSIALQEAVMSSGESVIMDMPGGVYIKRTDVMSEDDIALLRSMARVHIVCDGLGLGSLLELPEKSDEYSMGQQSSAPPKYVKRISGSKITAATDPATITSAGPSIKDDDIETEVEREREKQTKTKTDNTATSSSLSSSASADTYYSDEQSEDSSNDSSKGRSDHRPMQRKDDPQYFGRFNDAGEYEITISGAELPPAPWSNVVANEVGGFVVSESGSSCTWAGNSFFYRLTPWHNDPVRDPCSDCFYIRDERTGDIWSATPAPVREKTPYTIKHGHGYSIFEHQHDSIHTSLHVSMASSKPVKISRLTVTNTGNTPRQVTVTSYVEWVLGVSRDISQQYIRTTYSEELQAVLGQNYFDETYAHKIAFLAMSGEIGSYSGDRREFIGRNGTPARPAALSKHGLSESVGAKVDPCAALQTTITIPAGQSHEIVTILGADDSIESVTDLIKTHLQPAQADAASAQSINEWRDRLGIFNIQTPDPEFNRINNGWMLYQALSCRMWGRTALYQSSGAYGFRDQLQDCLAFVYIEPDLVREHIIRAAGRQFVEGDVQHWWHPQTGRGVRTRFTDDLIWLPYVVDHYIKVTGDESILDAEAPFITMRQLEPDEHEIYDLPHDSGETGTILEHCIRALTRGSTVGDHELPLIGCGDWNDGFSRVGIEGKGESVWLGWFLITTLTKFADRLAAIGNPDQVHIRDRFLQDAERYRRAIERNAWDGAWYYRAFFDDGTPLGSHNNKEARIDSIAQSWSVISGAGDSERARRAMHSVDQHLVDSTDGRLIRLLRPAFDKSEHDPGYIKGYLPGVRENGAQYTHAALWVVMARAMQGEGNRAFELYQLLNPLTHTRTVGQVQRYHAEPYVVAADVYTAEGHLGRGGWTWYTGSASWMFRVALESILGFTKRGDTFTLNPCIPENWEGFELDYRYHNTIYNIRVKNPKRVMRGVKTVSIDGVFAGNNTVNLVDDGQTHTVEVTLG